jgi:hypothetical protein
VSRSFRVLASWKGGIRLASDALDPTARIWFAARHHGEQFFSHSDAHFSLLDWQFKSLILNIECASRGTLLQPFPFQSIPGVRPARNF